MLTDRSYLIVGPSWVGDMVMAHALYADLKSRFPSCKIAVMAPQWSAALINRMPEVDELIMAPFEHGKLSLIERYRLGKKLRSKSFTHAIVLPNSIKAAIVPFLAKIPVRTGFLGEQRWGLINDIRRLDKTFLPMTVQRFLALGEAAGSSPAPVNALAVPRILINEHDFKQTKAKFALSYQKPVVAFCPGAEFGPSKQWPAEHFAQLATKIINSGNEVWIVGSAKDSTIANKINALSDNKCHVLTAKTSLTEVIDLLSSVQLVVSNDSGLMHIAAALNIPLVAIFGSTDAKHTPPLSDNHIILEEQLECRPCFKRDCPLGHLKCLRAIDHNRVIASINSGQLDASIHIR